MRFFASSLVSLLFCSTVFAAPAPSVMKGEFTLPERSIVNTITHVFKTKLNLTPDYIFCSEIPDLYEVHVGGQAFYSTGDAKYIIHGALIRTEYKTNLTAMRASKLSKVDVTTLPLDNAIRVTNGSGARVLFTFQDTLSDNSKKLYAELMKLPNTTIYTFIAGRNNEALAKSVFCSKDRVKAWKSLMGNGIKPIAPDCDSKELEENMKLMAKYKITTLPTVVLSNGDRFTDVETAHDIETILNFSTVVK